MPLVHPLRGVALAAMLITCQAQASPWTAPDGTLIVGLGVGATSARGEYTSDAVLTTWPLEQQLSSQDYTLSLRYGLTGRVELNAQGTYRYVTNRGALYPSDAASCTEPAVVGASCYDPNRDQRGPGDLNVSARFKLLSQPFVLSLSPVLKVPMGYEPPSVDTFTDPAVLGDGQIDAGAWLLLGQIVEPLHLLFRGGVGYLHRFGLPGDQLLLETRLGYLPSRTVIATVGLSGRVAVTEGGAWTEVGLDEQSFTLTAQAQPATREWLQIEAGIIWRLASNVELQAGGRAAAWGRNTSAARGLDAGVVFYF